MRDCELWVDFDTDYVDSQRSTVKDRSGYGRHPVASGAPSFGANGPDSFQAVSGDGNDDILTTGEVENPIEKGQNDEATLAVLASVNALQDRQTIFSFRSLGFGIETRSGFINFRLFDGNGNFVSDNITESTEEFKLYTIKFDSGTVIGRDSDGNVAKQVTDVKRSSGSYKILGRTGNDFLNGRIAFSAAWSRALADVEIDYLNQLTAARRAQL
jgi:hypothetical protein